MVQFFDAVEHPITQPGQNPALGELDPDLHRRLVFGLTWAGGHDVSVVVRRELGIGGIDQCTVLTRAPDDSRFEIVGHLIARDATKVGHRTGIALDPVRDLLALHRVGERLATCTQDGHEKLDLPPGPALGIGDPGTHAREVQEQLLPGIVDLAHDQPACTGVALVASAELRLRHTGLADLQRVLLMEQRQRDSRALILSMDMRPVGFGKWLFGGMPAWIESTIQLQLIQWLNAVPVQ